MYFLIGMASYEVKRKFEYLRLCWCDHRDIFYSISTSFYFFIYFAS